jgi:hypothetical protein
MAEETGTDGIIRRQNIERQNVKRQKLDGAEKQRQIVGLGSARAVAEENFGKLRLLPGHWRFRLWPEDNVT